MLLAKFAQAGPGHATTNSSSSAGAPRFGGAELGLPGGSRHANIQARGGECPEIGELPDLFRGGGIAVARVARDAQEDGSNARLRGLERGRELVRMAPHHAVVVIRGQQQRRGVAMARVNVV